MQSFLDKLSGKKVLNEADVVRVQETLEVFRASYNQLLPRAEEYCGTTNFSQLCQVNLDLP